uniref:Uncharacterized protein n=1 Tax=Musa acuminata subsp. malaccensis TaxID=214687 RepID=A0A804L9E6_MUSAM
MGLLDQLWDDTVAGSGSSPSLASAPIPAKVRAFSSSLFLLELIPDRRRPSI